jgi:hypothetical protein
MTQDQSGQAQGTGYVVRGEVVPDDETDERYADDAGPMTRLRKVASALRGDKPDETVPDETAAPNADTTDPNGSWSSRPGEPSTVSSLAVEDEADYADATDPDDVAAVRVPEAGDRDYWDNDADKTTAPGGDVTVDETTVPAGDVAADETMPPVGGVTVPGGGIAETVPDTGIDSGAPSYASQPATEYGRYGSQAGIATDPVVTGPNGAGLSGADVGTAESVPTGKHAAATAAEAGLRPGEATDRLGDFGDIAFGNLLPDAAQYSAQWQQIQFRFVDDPQGSVTEAADVLSQVTARLEAAIQERQRAIEERKQAIQERASALRGRWGEGSNADTETLRETLRMYRAFMDQLIGPAA